MGKEEFVQAVLALHLATQVTHKPSPQGTAGLGEPETDNLAPEEIFGTECVQKKLVDVVDRKKHDARRASMKV